MRTLIAGLLICSVLILFALSSAERPELYSLDDSVLSSESSPPYDTPLKVITRARGIGLEAQLPFTKIPRNEWLVKAERTSDGLWEVEYLTAAHVPQYLCRFLITDEGQATDPKGQCDTLK